MLKAGSNSNAILSVIASLWCPLLFGLCVGYTGPTGDTMSKVDAPGDLYILEDSGFVSIFGALFPVGCAFGALLAGNMVQMLGRRLTLMSTSPVFVLAFICMATTKQPGFLLFGRAASGVAVGVCSLAVPMYIAEVSPDSLRGALGALNQLLIVIGIALAYFLGLVFKDSDEIVQWRHFTWVYVFPSSMILSCMWFAPESPRYLAGIGKLDAAIKSLNMLRGGKASAQELSVLENTAQSQEDLQVENSSFVDLKSCRQQLIIGVTLHVLQQFSGINAVMLYMPALFKEAGLDKHKLLLSCLTALVQVVVTGIACVLMDMVGRRKLLLIASSGLTGCLVIMGAAMHAKEALIRAGFGLVFVFAIFGYIAFFSFGVGAIPWLILSEIFPDKTRATASAIATTVNWSCTVLIVAMMKTMQDAFGGPGLMWFYSVFCAILVAFTFFKLPETKGKSFEEIQAHFDGAPVVKLISAAVTSPGSETAEEKL